MGGRGSASNLKSGKTDIISFPTKKTAEQKLWQYPELVEHTEKLRVAVDDANTRRKVESVYRGLKEYEKKLTVLHNDPTEDGDKNVILTERRKTRQLLKKLIDKKIL